MENLLGLYEKALPKRMEWAEKLAVAKELGFDFMEISVDESDERLSRLDWSQEERVKLLRQTQETGVPLMSMCFSGHRRFPLGSRDPEIRQKSLELLTKAVKLARDIGIRVVQLAGYDVYYEEAGEDTREFFLEGLRKSAAIAERHQVMLAVEIMDTDFLNSIRKYMEYDKLVNSPWLTVYPDIGNLSAWGNDVEYELDYGKSRIVAVHIKETMSLQVSPERRFRDVPFGDGDVDFVTIFKKLKANGYAGPFVMEMWGDNVADPIAEIARSRDFVLGRLKEGGF